LPSPITVAPKKAKVSVGTDVLGMHRALREEAEQRRREYQAECTRHNRAMEALEERRVNVLEEAETTKMRATNMKFEMEQLLQYQEVVDKFGGVYTAAEIKGRMKSLKDLVRDEDFLP
jgi:formate dehydrogenase assembly factor FdhD